MGSAVASEIKSNGNNVSIKDSGYTRRAHHAGSWYLDEGVELRCELEGYLQDARKQQKRPSLTKVSTLRGLIVPHAGYRYSGPTAAYAYAAMQQSDMMVIDHVLVLHPSHHVYFCGCAVSGAAYIETPLGMIRVEDELRKEILSLSVEFTVMTQYEDENEHSGEMQYPFLAHIISRYPRISVLPVMVGALSTISEETFGRLLAPIILRPNVFTVVSSDFCHWGERFSYRPTPPRCDSTPIHEFIAELDHRGMSLIELQKPGAFATYLKESRNTICGRHPIAVWLNAITTTTLKTDRSVMCGTAMEVSFVKYAQSSLVKALHESSVSYASAIATLAPHV